MTGAIEVIYPREEPSSDWEQLARCRSVDPELFFPIVETKRCRPSQQSQIAIAICGGCAVRAECLEKALTTHEEFGIWGGLTSDQRRALLGRKQQVR